VETEFGRQTRRLQAGSGFLSQHSKEVLFGLGKAKGPVKATVEWPSGLVQQLGELPANHRVWVEEGSEAVRREPFRKAADVVVVRSQAVEVLPEKVETWLLTPVPAPEFAGLSALRGKTVLLSFVAPGTRAEVWTVAGLQRLTVVLDDVVGDVAGVYNLLYRYLFDRRRDMTLPVSFLINPQGEIVKVYQGLVTAQGVQADLRVSAGGDRMAMALPFRGNADNYTFGRNHLSLGSVFFQRGYFDQAEKFFGLALRDDASSAEARYGLGSVYLKQNRTAEARANFEQTTKLEPNYPDTLPNAWNNLGLLATREGRTERAVECFQEALRVTPGYWIALENLGNAFRQQKRFDEARETLLRAVGARPQDPEANYSLAMVYAQTDDTARAYEYLQKTLQLRPAYPEALNNLGVLYLRTRRRDEAVARFEECIRVAPGFDQSYLNLARVYALEGHADQARGVLRELLKQHPDHLQAKKALEQLP
jgi:tetratricopeptide (TPR) repeat protein